MEDKLELVPQTKAEIAEIHFGEKCALAGNQVVDGKVTAKAQTLQEEEVEQEIVGLGTTENNSLEVGGHKAYITGAVKVNLNLEESFAFQDGAGPLEIRGNPSFSVGAGGTLVRAFIFTNTPSVDYETFAIRTTMGARAFFKGPDGCSERVFSAGSMCEVTIEFKPLAAGSYRANLMLSYEIRSNGQRRTRDLGLMGTGT